MKIDFSRSPAALALALAITLALVFGCGPNGTTTRDSRDRLSPNETATVLAGLSSLDLSGRSAELIASAEEYRRAAESSWSYFELRRGQAMSEWAETAIDSAEGQTIFYPFGGPDFDSVHRFFPQATRYVLVALEKAGEVPDLATDDARLVDILEYYRLATQQFSRQGYFAGVDLDSRFEQPVGYLSGVLLSMAARAGFEILEAEPIRLERELERLVVDQVDHGPPELWSSIRIRMRRGDGVAVTLEYVSLDLSDEAIADEAGTQAWLGHMSTHPVFLKAAGHLPQRVGPDLPSYSILRRALLEKAPSVLQDEAGLGYSDLDSRFEIRLFGEFTEPAPMFSHEEADSGFVEAMRSLIAAYRERPDIEPLSFPVGYSKASGPALIYAHKRRS